MGRDLGVGTFAKVMYATKLTGDKQSKNKKEYAIKVIDKDSLKQNTFGL